MNAPTMSIGLLPVQKFNYRALFTAFALQSMLVLVLVQMGIIQPVKLMISARNVIYTPLVMPVETTPKFQPTVRGYIPPVAKLVVPKPPPPIPSPVIEPPKIEMRQAKVPTLPTVSTPLPRPVVQVGAFLPSSQEPTLPKSLPSSQVQTGGFGDPNGVKGIGDGKSKLTISSLGSFGMPSGPGYGNGTGGTHGKAGVVQSSGFDAGAATSSTTTKVSVIEHDTGKPVTILGHIKPNYTDEGRKLGIQGEVLIRVSFTVSGHVRIIGIVQGLGHGLDEQAVIAAEKIQFKPAELNGHPIDSEATVHVIFELAS
jgi:TonB family protein